LNEYITEAPELPKSRAGADFWLNFGSSILAQPGGRPILQTLGTAGQEPLAQYQKQKSQEDILKYKHGQGERQFQLEIYKAMSDDDKIALEKEINYLMEEHGLTKEEALKRAMPKYRKPMSEEDVARQAAEYERDKMEKDTALTQSGISRETVYVNPNQAEIINKFYDQAHAQDPVWEYESDIPFIDKQAIKNEWIKLKGADYAEDQWVHKDSGNIAISPDEQATYEEGYYYVDRFNGDVYKVSPGSTELIKIVIDEEPIN